MGIPQVGRLPQTATKRPGTSGVPVYASGDAYIRTRLVGWRADWRLASGGQLEAAGSPSRRAGILGLLSGWRMCCQGTLQLLPPNSLPRQLNTQRHATRTTPCHWAALTAVIHAAAPGGTHNTTVTASLHARSSAKHHTHTRFCFSICDVFLSIKYDILHMEMIRRISSGFWWHWNDCRLTSQAVAIVFLAPCLLHSGGIWAAAWHVLATQFLISKQNVVPQVCPLENVILTCGENSWKRWFNTKNGCHSCIYCQKKLWQ